MDRTAPDIDRLLSALHRVKPDRTPNFEVMFNERNTSHLLGRPAGTFWAMPPGEAVELVQRVGQDAIVCSCTLTDNRAVVAGPADLDELEYSDPQAVREKMLTYLDAVAGTRVGVCARIGGPLCQTYMACAPVPIESFMYLLYDQPELVETMLERFTEGILRVLDAIAPLPFHLFYLGDDLGTNLGPMISPKHIANLWAPRYERIVRAMQATGRPIINHCCGDQSSVLPWLRRWGVDATHPIQPGPNDIDAIHREHGAHLALIGNIDVAGILSCGTPDEVYRDTVAHIERFGPGYVVCSSHSIIDSVPPENYLAMVRAAHECG